jgi:hypothetical protein
MNSTLSMLVPGAIDPPGCTPIASAALCAASCGLKHDHGEADVVDGCREIPAHEARRLPHGGNDLLAKNGELGIGQCLSGDSCVYDDSVHALLPLVDLPQVVHWRGSDDNEGHRACRDLFTSSSNPLSCVGDHGVPG